MKVKSVRGKMEKKFEKRKDKCGVRVMVLRKHVIVKSWMACRVKFCLIRHVRL